jgi:hypothetical protein
MDDPVFTLSKSVLNKDSPNKQDRSEKYCKVCFAKNGNENLCDFCCNRVCKDCSLKKRAFPAQSAIANPDEKHIKGIICKQCERKFQMKMYYMMKDPEIN